MFKLPSLHSIISEFKIILNRFPLVIISSFLGTFLAIFLFEKEYDNVYLFNLLVVLTLSISLFISNYLFCESNNLDKINKFITFSISFFLLIIYYFSLPNNYKYFEYLSDQIISFWIYFIALHLLVSFIPFLKSKNYFSFWEYNNIFFTRLVMALFFSQLLYLGISIGLLAINTLFEIKINQKLYFEIGIIIFAIFHTCFFLAGIPKKFEIDYIPSIPQYVKSLSQYVLIPIVLVYLIILYLYTGKIIINMNWPKGGVSYLIIACSFIGILSVLLIYPLQKQIENSLLKIFPKFFYISIIPMIFVLFFAIERRVRDYGITENRYLLIVIAIWLLFISVYFLIDKKQNIKIIPISLFIICFIINFGPLSIFNISYNSQFNRLKNILEKNSILIDNKIYKTSKKLKNNDIREISAIVDYLVHRGKEEYLISLFENKLDLKSLSRHSKSEKIVKEMGLQFIHNYRYIDNNFTNNKFFNFYSNNKNKILDIKNYDIVLFFSDNMYDNNINIENKDNKFLIQLFNNNLILYQNNIKISEITIKNFINNLREKYIVNNKYDINPEELSIYHEDKKIRIKIYFNTLGGDIENNNKIKLNFISGNIFIDYK